VIGQIPQFGEGVFFSRCFSEAGAPFTVLLALVTAYYVLELVKVILGSAFGVFKEAFLSCCCKYKEKKNALRPSRDFGPITTCFCDFKVQTAGGGAEGRGPHYLGRGAEEVEG